MPVAKDQTYCYSLEMSNVPVEFPKHIPTAERTVQCSFPQHPVARQQQLTALISGIRETHPNS